MRSALSQSPHAASSFSSLSCLLIALVIVSSGVALHACPSGLIVIPTADMVDAGCYGVELQFDGVFASGGDETLLLDTQFGLTPRLEAGVDFDLSDDADTRLLLNAKYLFVADSEDRPALAVGICGVGSGLKASPFLVASHDFGPARCHLGAGSFDGDGRWFVGVDRACGEHLTLMADYTNGSDNCASIGGNYQFTERFGVMAGVLLPNASGEDTGYSVHLVYSAPFRSAAKGD